MLCAGHRFLTLAELPKTMNVLHLNSAQAEELHLRYHETCRTPSHKIKKLNCMAKIPWDALQSEQLRVSRLFQWLISINIRNEYQIPTILCPRPR
jgi:hypothetical protein